MVYDRDPDQDISDPPASAKHTRWELSTLVIGLIVILTGGHLIVASPSADPPAGFQRIETTQKP